MAEWTLVQEAVEAGSRPTELARLHGWSVSSTQKAWRKVKAGQTIPWTPPKGKKGIAKLVPEVIERVQAAVLGVRIRLTCNPSISASTSVDAYVWAGV